jgi:hypothetical protein
MIAPLLGFDTPVVNVQNGIPWWYFHGLDGKWKDARLESVDPGGVIREHIDPARVIGGIAYCSSRVIEPGVISHLNNIRFLLGEPDGTVSERARRLSDAIVSAGLESPVSTSIREQIWVKVHGNAPFNPISALTGATMEQMMLCAESRRGRRVRLRYSHHQSTAARFRGVRGRAQNVDAPGLRSRPPARADRRCGHRNGRKGRPDRSPPPCDLCLREAVGTPLIELIADSRGAAQDGKISRKFSQSDRISFFV